MEKIKKIGFLSVCILFLCTCCKQEEKSYKEIMKEKEYVIVDVRTEEEFLEAHIVDAINIPYDQIDEDITITKDKNIFVYCKSGNRSQKAYETFKSLGYQVYDLGAYANIDLPKSS